MQATGVVLVYRGGAAVAAGGGSDYDPTTDADPDVGSHAEGSVIVPIVGFHAVGTSAPTWDQSAPGFIARTSAAGLFAFEATVAGGAPISFPISGLTGRGNIYFAYAVLTR